MREREGKKRWGGGTGDKRSTEVLAREKGKVELAAEIEVAGKRGGGGGRGEG